MKRINNITIFTFVCVLLISLCHISKCDGDTEAAAASDYYAKFYQDYYNSLSAKEDTDRDTGYHEPTAYHEPHEPSYGYETTSYDDDLGTLFGPETGIIVSFAALLLGIVNTIAFVLLDSRVGSLENDQDSICTTAQALGNTNLAATDVAAPSQATNAASINRIITQINGYATPDC